MGGVGFVIMQVCSGVCSGVGVRLCYYTGVFMCERRGSIFMQVCSGVGVEGSVIMQVC